eukprot:jgi/Bigna1/86276/estExt_fgenesh1_pg.C_90170
MQTLESLLSLPEPKQLDLDKDFHQRTQIQTDIKKLVEQTEEDIHSTSYLSTEREQLRRQIAAQKNRNQITEEKLQSLRRRDQETGRQLTAFQVADDDLEKKISTLNQKMEIRRNDYRKIATELQQYQRIFDISPRSSLSSPRSKQRDGNKLAHDGKELSDTKNGEQEGDGAEDRSWNSIQTYFKSACEKVELLHHKQQLAKLMASRPLSLSERMFLKELSVFQKKTEVDQKAVIWNQRRCAAVMTRLAKIHEEKINQLQEVESSKVFGIIDCIRQKKMRMGHWPTTKKPSCESVSSSSPSSLSPFLVNLYYNFFGKYWEVRTRLSQKQAHARMFVRWRSLTFRRRKLRSTCRGCVALRDRLLASTSLRKWRRKSYEHKKRRMHVFSEDIRAQIRETQEKTERVRRGNSALAETRRRKLRTIGLRICADFLQTVRRKKLTVALLQWKQLKSTQLMEEVACETRHFAASYQADISLAQKFASLTITTMQHYSLQRAGIKAYYRWLGAYRTIAAARQSASRAKRHHRRALLQSSITSWRRAAVKIDTLRLRMQVCRKMNEERLLRCTFSSNWKILTERRKRARYLLQKYMISRKSRRLCRTALSVWQRYADSSHISTTMAKSNQRQDGLRQPSNQEGKTTRILLTSRMESHSDNQISTPDHGRDPSYSPLAPSASNSSIKNIMEAETTKIRAKISQLSFGMAQMRIAERKRFLAKRVRLYSEKSLLLHSFSVWRGHHTKRRTLRIVMCKRVARMKRNTLFRWGICSASRAYEKAEAERKASLQALQRRLREAKEKSKRLGECLAMMRHEPHAECLEQEVLLNADLKAKSEQNLALEQKLRVLKAENMKMASSLENTRREGRFLQRKLGVSKLRRSGEKITSVFSSKIKDLMYRS